MQGIGEGEEEFLLGLVVFVPIARHGAGRDFKIAFIEAAEPAEAIGGPAAEFAELAIADDIDARLRLTRHHLGDGCRQAGRERGIIDGDVAGHRADIIEQLFRPRQAADMGGQNAVFLGHGLPLATHNPLSPGAGRDPWRRWIPAFAGKEKACRLSRLTATYVKIEIPVADRDGWECYFNARKAEVEALSRRIADAEAEINDRVYRLFGLDHDEIALIEDAIAGQY